MIELAETLQAPVLGGGRDIAQPRIRCAGGGSIASADVILALQQDDLWGRPPQLSAISRSARPGSMIKLSGEESSASAPSDLYYEEQLSGLPALRGSRSWRSRRMRRRRCRRLIEACRKARMTADRRRLSGWSAASRLAAANAKRSSGRAPKPPTAWDASPDQHRSGRRPERAEAVQDEGLGAASTAAASRLWNIDKFYRDDRRRRGGGGPARDCRLPVGAALAHRKHGRLASASNRDGDLMMRARRALDSRPSPHSAAARSCTTTAPITRRSCTFSAWPTAASAAITASVGIGTPITEPEHRLRDARPQHGSYGEGPITESRRTSGPALKRAVARVERGETGARGRRDATTVGKEPACHAQIRSADARIALMPAASSHWRQRRLPPRLEGMLENGKKIFDELRLLSMS